MFGEDHVVFKGNGGDQSSLAGYKRGGAYRKLSANEEGSLEYHSTGDE